MTIPDYQRSIVNLSASISTAMGGRSPHVPLPELPVADLSPARHVVLLVVDGLGYHYLQACSGCLRDHLRVGLSSVFPSTTASAIPTFMTGLSPREHGLTGWHMYLRETGSIIATLPFRFRAGHQSATEAGLTPAGLYGLAPQTDHFDRPCHAVSPRFIIESDFNVALSGQAQRHGYGSLEEMFAIMEYLLRGTREQSFIHAYWPDLDSLSHTHGVASPQAAAVLEALDRRFEQFLARIRGTGTTVIVTADHGFIDTTPEDTIDLGDHPALRECLVLPLCGEPRVSYAYLRSGREADFLGYIDAHLGDRLDVHRSVDLVEHGWFGPGRSHPALASRIGDYTLIPKGRAILRDWLPGETRYTHVGVHGGLSEAEMYVPLVVARTN